MNRKLMLFSILLTIITSGCSKTEETTSAVIGKESIKRGEKIFTENCQSCHPRSGRGDYLKRIPATLLIRRSEYELIDWIQGNEKHREMPNFDHLERQQLEDLAAFLKDEISR